ncbi:hypothetical protein LWF01_15435 [Saxibacter everestensis]|uniref:Alpha/beta hydrolase n=1 Tax=Saxibacter everestensis TaxID=2909229 RepID=A0ABY8QRL3_9MICO|nr:hypothetical protein LWF01_15435 [Brevibacteriaceae bacterium ZFBP1038]
MAFTPDTWSDQGGRTAIYALPSDQRFSYCLFHPQHAEPPRGLLVAIHGTERDVIGTREAFIPFAAANNLVILAPLFPAGIQAADDVDGYKLLQAGLPRYDQLLLSMVDEAGRRLRLPRSDIYLCGFSGGAQFAHRFLYLHSDRVAAVSIAAPGRITPLDDSADWWHGTGNIAVLFGQVIDRARIRDVVTHVVVGADDVGTAEHGDRVQHARRLHASFRDHGVRARLDIVPGVQHQLAGLVPAISDFFTTCLQDTPQSTTHERAS